MHLQLKIYNLCTYIILSHLFQQNNSLPLNKWQSHILPTAAVNHTKKMTLTPPVRASPLIWQNYWNYSTKHLAQEMFPYFTPHLAFYIRVKGEIVVPNGSEPTEQNRWKMVKWHCSKPIFVKLQKNTNTSGDALSLPKSLFAKCPL